MVHALGRVKSHRQAFLLQIEPAYQGGWANALQIDLQLMSQPPGWNPVFTELQNTFLECLYLQTRENWPKLGSDPPTHVT